MSSEYTPTVGELRQAYVEASGASMAQESYYAEQVAEFERGIARIKAEANPKPRTITRKRAHAVAVKASDRFGGIVEPDAVRLLLGVAFLELGIEVVGDE